jgi:hypothetical protein
LTKNYKINDLSDDAQILSIGSFFRKLTVSTWGVNLTFFPPQDKPSLSVSYASTLVRKRYLNQTLEHSPTGYNRTASIESTQNWKVTSIGECPALRGKNTLKVEASQYCFTFHGELDTTFFIPQFELARVLFLQNGYLSRTALEPDCLNIEFDITVDPLTGSRSIINIPLSSGYPVSSLNDEQCRQKLSWILLDPDARASYESIGQSQKLNGVDRKGYRFWNFQFTPPALPLCEFDFKGIFDKETNCMFVYEIAAMRNISCKVPSMVRFKHPKFRENLKPDGTQGTASTPKPALDYILEDDAETNVSLQPPHLKTTPAALHTHALSK